MREGVMGIADHSITFFQLQIMGFCSSIMDWLELLRWGLSLTPFSFSIFFSILGVGFYLMPIFLGMYRSRVLLIIRRDFFSVIYCIDASGKTIISQNFILCWFCMVVWCGCFCRWNSWNFFACNINETVIKETGAFVFLFSILSVQMLTLHAFMVLSL